MYVVGLTGGIGSGKSTVAELFEEKGIKVIDTDQLARELTQRGHEAYNKILAHFGKQVLLPNGALNRKRLRAIIFADITQRRWLEQLLHPLIRAEIQRQVESAKSPYCIVVVPLLFETTPNPIINRVLVVDASEEKQLQRVQKRDNSTVEEAKAIVNTQVTREHRLAHAEDVLYNDGSIEDLKESVEKLHKLYLSASRGAIT